MPQRSTERRRTVAQSGEPVGRCCQRHVITGQVITDWYPLQGDGELVNKYYSQGTQHNPPREPVRRRTRRRTVSCASDSIPVQSGLLCAGIRYVTDKHKCNFRFTFETEHTSERSEKRALALPQLGRWEYPAKPDRAHRPLAPDTSADQAFCDTLTRSIELLRQHSRFTGQQRTTITAEQLLCPEPQKGGRQPWANGVPFTVGGRHPRRRVLDPGHSMNLGWVRERWCGDQNPIGWYTIGIKNVCDSGVLSGDLTSTEDLPFCHREVGR